MSSNAFLPDSTKSFHRGFFILILVAAFTALLFNGRRSLWDTSETRYAETSRAMAVSGDYLVPRLDGAVHLTKPPLTYWSIAASFRAFGKSEWAARLPSALAYIASVALTVLLARQITGSAGAALAAGWLQLSAPLALAGSHVVTTDGLLAALELAYVLAFWKVRDAKTYGHARLWSLVMWTFVGLAFLTKGPPALLPALACLVYAVLQRNQLKWRRYFYPEALAAFITVGGWWFVVVLLKVPNALAVWKLEALHKVAVESTRNMPALLYLPILVVGSLPASAAIILFWKRRSALPPAARLFVIIWVLVPLSIFMLAKTRLPLYVIPLVPAISILGGAIVSSAQWTGNRARAAIALPIIISAAFLTMKFSTPWWDDESKDFKVIAEAIRDDAAARGAHPHLILTMPVMGHGLSFYLDGPQLVRTDRSTDTPGDSLVQSTSSRLQHCFPPNASRSQRLACVLATPQEAGSENYVVAQAIKAPRFQMHFPDYLTTVTANTKWVAWRQSQPLPPDYQVPSHKNKSR